MMDRRRFMESCTGLGLGSTLFPGVLWAQSQGKDAVKITKEMIEAAAAVADVAISEEYKQMMLDNLNEQAKGYEAIYALHIPNSVEPALLFDPVVNAAKYEMERRAARLSTMPNVSTPKKVEELAFASVRELAELVRTKRVSSSALTEMYLGRLKRYDPLLKFTVTLTEERAQMQARDADREIAAGKYRGPLHGLPWGAKDLLAVKGYRTTWGAAGFEKQTVDEDATVVQRLDHAGAVLIAKLTLGALALGDKWFGGQTRNPWNPRQGSSGSSAGSASATAAGCVAFAIGSETLGSISSPSTRCGATGLRPTFGRVPRTGAMALSWTMDKLGPICRSVEDCALVLSAIYGPDGQDNSVIPAGYHWNAQLSPRKLRVGYVKSAFDTPLIDPADAKRTMHATKPFDDAALDVFRRLGINLIPVDLPDVPYDAMRIILTAEAAAAFDDLTRSNRDNELVQQGKFDWPNTFRTSRFIPAVDYVNANRLRSVAIQKWDDLMRTVDVIVTPTGAANLSQLVATNLTGHPAVIIPNGFREDGTPVSITFLGGLFEEAKMLAVARAYQEATGFHLKHPIVPLTLPAPPVASPPSP